MDVKCEVCSSSSIQRIDGIYKCLNCGVQYSLEDLRAMMQKEKTEQTIDIPLPRNKEPSRIPLHVILDIPDDHFDEPRTYYADEIQVGFIHRHQERDNIYTLFPYDYTWYTSYDKKNYAQELFEKQYWQFFSESEDAGFIRYRSYLYVSNAHNVMGMRVKNEFGEDEWRDVPAEIRVQDGDLILRDGSALFTKYQNVLDCLIRFVSIIAPGSRIETGPHGHEAKNRLCKLLKNIGDCNEFFRICRERNITINLSDYHDAIVNIEIVRDRQSEQSDQVIDDDQIQFQRSKHYYVVKKYTYASGRVDVRKEIDYTIPVESEYKYKSLDD